MHPEAPHHLRPSDTDAWLDLLAGCRGVLAGLCLSLILLIGGLWLVLLVAARVLS